MTLLRHAAVLLPALLVAGCSADESGAFPTRSCDVTLTYVPAQSNPGTVAVVGEWDGLSTRGRPMVDRGDGVYTLTLTGLEPRDYGYMLQLNDKQVRDPGNPYSRWVSSEELSLLRVEDCRVPQLRLERFTVTPQGRLDVDVEYLDGSEGVGPDVAKVRLSLDDELQVGTFNEGTRRLSLGRDGLAPGKHRVKVTAVDAAGREAAPLFLPFWVEPGTFRWESGAMYFAFTDRFRNGDPTNDAPTLDVAPIANYQGGDFAGITQALEEGYFDALGVKSLWLSPVDRNPDGRFSGTFDKFYTGFHGYWPSEPRATQPRFGSIAELRALTDAAHRRGIRVLADLVLNHVHEDHPYFRDHGQDGWFNQANSCVCGSNNCGWEQMTLTCKFTSYLPDYNWRSQRMVDQFVADTLWWLEAADFDGFRMDAVKHIDQTAVRTLRGKLREITEQTGTGFYLVGETFVGSDGRSQIARYVGPTQLDGQFDFPLYWPLREAFADGQGMERVEGAVSANERFYAPDTLNSPFLGNHDVTRFISAAAGQITSQGDQAWSNPPPQRVTDANAFLKAKYAFGFLLTQPGVPLIYYGDEVGLPGAGDPDNRRFMRFGSELAPQEQDLLAFVRKLGAARAASPALQTGARRLLKVEADFYAYQRDTPEGQGALIAINRADTERSVVVGLQGGLAAASGTYTDLFSGRTVALRGTETRLTVPARSVAVFVP
ncbi:alpha-amylase family glycosyl hydrolase [Myxococcaceae bacterium GXIMD 01537]